MKTIISRENVFLFVFTLNWKYAQNVILMFASDTSPSITYLFGYIHLFLKLYLNLHKKPNIPNFVQLIYELRWIQKLICPLYNFVLPTFCILMACICKN